VTFDHEHTAGMGPRRTRLDFAALTVSSQSADHLRGCRKVCEVDKRAARGDARAAQHLRMSVELDISGVQRRSNPADVHLGRGSGVAPLLFIRVDLSEVRAAHQPV
jgi:hypothetical protein